MAPCFLLTQKDCYICKPLFCSNYKLFTAGNSSGNVVNRQFVGHFGNGTSPSRGVRQGNGNQRASSTQNHGGYVQGNVDGSGASGNSALGGIGGRGYPLGILFLFGE